MRNIDKIPANKLYPKLCGFKFRVPGSELVIPRHCRCFNKTPGLTLRPIVCGRLAGLMDAKSPQDASLQFFNW